MVWKQVKTYLCYTVFSPATINWTRIWSCSYLYHLPSCGTDNLREMWTGKKDLPKPSSKIWREKHSIEWWLWERTRWTVSTSFRSSFPPCCVHRWPLSWGKYSAMRKIILIPKVADRNVLDYDNVTYSITAKAYFRSLNQNIEALILYPMVYCNCIHSLWNMGR